MSGTCRASFAGFTLIEVMMATTILLAGFIGMIQAVTIGSESLDTARKQQIAAQIIASEVEKLRDGPWSRIAALPATGAIAIGAGGAITGDTTSFALSNHTAAVTDDNTVLASVARGFACSFTRTWLRPASASAGTVTYLKLVYTVTWTSNTGRKYSRRAETYLGMNGLHLSYQKS